jgi:hypothetical protein
MMLPGQFDSGKSIALMRGKGKIMVADPLRLHSGDFVALLLEVKGTEDGGPKTDYKYPRRSCMVSPETYVTEDGVHKMAFVFEI